MESWLVPLTIKWQVTVITDAVTPEITFTMIWLQTETVFTVYVIAISKSVMSLNQFGSN